MSLVAARVPVSVPPLSGGADRGAAAGEVSLAAVFTLVVWVVCLTVGALGLGLDYSRPRPSKAPPPPVLAQAVEVEMAPTAMTPTEPMPAPASPTLPLPSPPPAAAPQPIPEAPPLLAVAEPSAAIAFPLPVTAPARVVAPAQAAYARPQESPATVAPALPARPLTFGQGEGKQPAPEYPRAAVLAGQEGTVRVLFTVGEDGRVLAAEVAASSPWPLLNEAALRAVRHRWRFTPGSVRLYEVPISFQLQK